MISEGEKRERERARRKGGGRRGKEKKENVDTREREYGLKFDKKKKKRKRTVSKMIVFVIIIIRQYDHNFISVKRECDHALGARNFKITYSSSVATCTERGNQERGANMRARISSQ